MWKEKNRFFGCCSFLLLPFTFSYLLSCWEKGILNFHFFKKYVVCFRWQYDHITETFLNYYWFDFICFTSSFFLVVEQAQIKRWQKRAAITIMEYPQIHWPIQISVLLKDHLLSKQQLKSYFFSSFIFFTIEL